MKEKVRFIFSKNFFVILAILIELAAFIALVILFTEHFLIFRTVASILVILLGFRIVISKSTASYKLIWMLFLLIFPFVGLVFYLLFAEDKFSYREKKKLQRIYVELKKATVSKYYKDAADEINKDKHPEACGIAKYIENASGFPLFANTKTTYFPWGEDAFPVIVDCLKKAKHYIFVEYFIIAKGKMWDTILEVLKEKAAAGLDVRVVYDDFGCLHTLPGKYVKELESYGIKAIKYARLRPFLDVRMNNRDHRKILVIDGHTGFTGGINLADEYINEIVRFGKWKDNAIMLEGDAVYGLTVMFLSAWAMNKNDFNIDYSKYLPAVYSKENPNFGDNTGYSQPYCSVPYLYESIGQNVYIDLCLKAKKYLYITTPYLILDDEMRNALCLAAKNGVDVRIITPHIPDKKLVFELTRSNYLHLLEAGVRIFEYSPGFIHAKTFIADDELATVGTINLDYRSLYLHLENGTFMYKEEAIKDIKKDFEETFVVCQEISLEEEKSIKWYRKLLRAILKVFAPLM